MPLKERWPHPQDARIQNDRTPETAEEKADSSLRAQAAVDFNNAQEGACQRNERARVQQLIAPKKEK